MVSEHIQRNWTGHRQDTIRPAHEYCGVEIFSFEHKLTRKYTPNDAITGSNHKKVSHRHLTCYESSDSKKAFYLNMVYPVQEIGEYRIDILYENKNSKDNVGNYSFKSSNVDEVYSENVITSLKELNPKINEVNVNIVTEDDVLGKGNIKFDGEKNILKRKTIFTTVKETGNRTLSLELPANVYFIGVIIRKIVMFTGDNLDTVGTNMALPECEVTMASQINPAEANFSVYYDYRFDNILSRTGLYMNYMDEVNVYYKTDADEGEVLRRFGGYVSNVNLNEDKTEIKFSCADRRIDGEHKFILDSLLILKGTGDDETSSYVNPINFETYGQALKYLADIHEVTLDSNIQPNYLVDGEKYNKGQAIKFGKKKDIKKVTVINAEYEVNKNFIMIRNKPESDKVQKITLYDAKAQKLSKPLILKDITKKDDVQEFLTFHMTYGLGSAKKTSQSTTYSTDSSNSAGSQKFSKCGVSADGKYVMGIGLPSAGKDSKSGWTKGVFERKCPKCGSTKVIWDWNWGSGKACNGRYEGGSSEGHFFCIGCDADFSVQGWEHVNGSRARMKAVSNIVSSSKAEAQKLKAGNMVAVPNTAGSLSADDVLSSIAKIAKQYTYKKDGNTSSTYSAMKKSGHGDCHAFSDLIFTELKKRKVACRIYEYATGQSNVHRSVVYKNAKGQWTNFPYKKYGLNRMLYPTSGLKLNSSPFKRYDTGGTIVDAKGSSSSSSTTTVTTTTGYDKDKPIQGFIRLIYSASNDTSARSFKAKTKYIDLNFTLKSPSNSAISGLSTVWVNNATRKTSVDMKTWFEDNEPNKNIYLHQIQFITPKAEKDSEGKYQDWYTFDKSTHDYSSCKMDLYNIIFDNRQALNPTDLQACGKSISNIMEEIVKSSGYRVKMTYALHRCDDKINFSVDNQTEPVFVAKEGDDNNILEWSSINDTPVSNLRNKSICVFKKADKKYYYVDTGDINSILEYGEQATLTTISEDNTSEKEAYHTARSSDDYNPDHDYSYTIVVPYAPLLHIGDLIKILANAQQLNDVKTIQSLKIKYSNSSMPRIRTEIGCDEVEPFLRIRKEQERLRKEARSESTYFGTTATPIEDEDVYIWDT